MSSSPTTTPSPSSQSAERFFRPFERYSLFAAVCIVLLVASCVGSSRSLWLDEAFTAMQARETLQSLLAQSLEYDAHPPLYAALMGGWTKVFGYSEVALRGFSALLYLLTALGVYATARLLVSADIALVAASLFAVNPIASMHAQNARSYALLAFLVVCSLYVFLRLFFCDERRFGLFVAFCLINALGLFTHYWFIFSFFSQGLAILLLARGSFRLLPRFLAVVLGSFGIFALLWGSNFFEQLRRTSTNHLEYTQLTDFSSAVLELYGGTYEALLFYFIILLLGFLRVTRNPKYRHEELSAMRKSLALFGILAAGALFSPIFVSYIKPVFMTKGTVIVVPALAILLALWLSRARPGLVWAFCLLLCLVVSLKIVHAATQEDPNTDRNATQVLLKHSQGNEILLFTSLSQPAVCHYLQMFAPERHYEQIFFPAELRRHPAWRFLGSGPQRMSALRQEAKDLVQQILRRNPPRCLYMFYGSDLEISQPLKDELEQYFQRREALEVGGSFFKQIFYYCAK